MFSSLPDPADGVQLADFLEAAFRRYNQPGFISDDPISLPHSFSSVQDRELIGFWAATLAWGQRKTIIRNARRLVELMDGAPHDFMLNHTEQDRARFLDFKHRTFQATDTLWFLEFFQQYYRKNVSRETFFRKRPSPGICNLAT